MPFQTPRGRRMSRIVNRVLADPSESMFRTHTLVQSANPIDISDRFPSRDEPISLLVLVRRESTLSNGLLFELGGTGRGIAAWVDGGDLGFAAGSSDADDGVTLLAENVLADNSDSELNGRVVVHRCLFACHPNTGEAQIWIGPDLVKRGTAANGNFGGGWSGPGDGAIGTVESTAISRVPGPQATALSNVTVAGPVYAYYKQFPGLRA